MYKEDYFQMIRKTAKVEKNKDAESIHLFMAMGQTANNHLVKAMEYELADTPIEITSGDFNRYWEELLLEDKQADAIHIHESSFQLYLAEDFEAAVWQYVKQVEQICAKYPDTLLIINTLEYLPFRPTGNLEAVDEQGLVTIIREANIRLFALADNHIKINDTNYIANFVGLQHYFDTTMLYHFSYGSSLEGQYYCAQSLRNILKAWLGKAKKGIISDLDNTYWPGIIGDKGAEMIQANLQERKNSNHRIYQKHLKKLEAAGIFMAAASKNDASISTEAKKLADFDWLFSLKQLNWLPKSDNLQAIAKKWNINPRDTIFIDDNQRELAEIKATLGEEQPTLHYNNQLDLFYELEWRGYFEKISLTETDKARNNNFKKNEAELASSTDLTSFLQSLQIELTYEAFTEANEARVIQLLNKTNQFNNNKTIFTLSKLKALEAEGKKITAVSYRDRLGEEGIISVVIHDETPRIHYWVMSCRVFKRGVEEAISKHIGMGNKIQIDYRKTDKNHYFQDFLQSELGKKYLTASLLTTSH